MRTPILLLSLVALAVLLPLASSQRSRGQSQARRPSTEAPSYEDDYYYEDPGDEDSPKKGDKGAAAAGGRGGSAGSSSSGAAGSGSRKSEPADEDYDAPPAKAAPSKSAPSKSASTAKPAAASTSSSRAKPAESKPAPPEPEEEVKKSGPISPSTLFLAPRKNRLHRPNVHYAARPRPTLPSFIKHPPPLGAISTTVTPKPRSAVTEEPRVARTTAKTKTSTASSSKNGGANGRFNGGASGRKRDRSTTESPASTDGERGNRRFGGNTKTKNPSRPRFRAGSNA